MNLIVPTAPPDAIVEKVGEGLFYNTGEPVEEPVQVRPVEASPQEPELPPAEDPEEGGE